MTKRKKKKQRIAELEDNIRELVLNPNSVKSLLIKSSVIFVKRTEDMLMFGDPPTNRPIKPKSNENIRQLPDFI